ncbi:hypothetical protein A8C56_07470 [Niabella ginsenosidivorans]|uniref:BON domain-containing protein n=1 Tax=Niabella ginsenosidivorans TaxID=1176587 RepID=A0A1A9IAR7_9BACT|nr:BON domain-containing protein [Niabella ginsenosidivorans]ANH83771.1 hypothetical protein A8C56_07470 [Niabella ginsenosidivorans]
MKSDKKIREDVLAELQWEPVLNATEIGVAVHNGVVTLSGNVDSFAKKTQAELVAKRVKGVKAVAIDINVDRWPEDNSNDTEVAAAIIAAFRYHTLVPKDKIRVKVENGWVTLEGAVEWQYQKKAAYDAIDLLQGVKGISDLIAVKPVVNKAILKDDIKRALERNADIQAANIDIQTSGNKVILKGQAGSWHEKNIIQRAAWASPGVTDVKDEIEVV